MRQGECKFCHRIGELRNSHSIPAGFFRPLLKKSNGSAIGIPLGAGKIAGSNDTGEALILCSECEGYFNKAWDAPLVNVLKRLDKKVFEEGFSARVEFSHSQFAQAVASVVWRSCVSDAPMYSNTFVSDQHLNDIIRIINTSTDESLKLCSVSLRRLWDRRGDTGEGFDQGSIAQIIVPPVSRSFGSKGKIKGFGFDMVVQGFLIHIAIPRPPFSKVRSSGFLSPGKTILHAPKINIFDYQPFVDLLVGAYAKFDAGEVSGKARR